MVSIFREVYIYKDFISWITYRVPCNQVTN